MPKQYRQHERQPGTVLSIWVTKDLRDLIQQDADRAGITPSWAAHHRLRQAYQLPTTPPPSDA